MFRVLVTGSRDWSDAQVVELLMQDIKRNAGEDVVLVSGNCPSGADKIAEDIAIKFGWTLELHPAQWKEHGKRAGFVRNAEMVELGADICLAFIKDESAGATNTVTKARIAKIPTVIKKEVSPVKTTPDWVLALANA